MLASNWKFTSTDTQPKVNKIRYFKIYLGFLLLIGSTYLTALEWITSPSLIDQKEFQILKLKYPTVKNAAHLEKILSAINVIKPLKRLNASFQDDFILISGTHARIISDIKLNFSTRNYEASLQSRLYKYIGQVDSKEAAKQLKELTVSYLKSRGLYQAVVTVSPMYNNETMTYSITAVEGFPCRIREITTTFTLPKNIKIDLRLGELCDREMISKTVEKLEEDLKDSNYKSHNIREPEIRWDSQSNSATIHFSGKIGRKIAYQVKTTSRINDTDLNEINNAIFEPDSMASELINNYRNDGHDDVEIIKRTIEKQSDTITYIFHLNPGPRYVITDAQFQGNTVFTQEELLEIMKLKSVFYVQIPLNRQQIREGIDALKNRYNSQGYWDAKISFPRITKNSQKRQTKLVYSIIEGKRRLFDGIIIKGNSALNRNKIRQMLELEMGKPLVWQQLIDFEQKLKVAYTKRGFVHASFTIDLIPHTKFRTINTKIVVHIEEKKRVRIGEITVTGLIKTKPVVVKRELRFQSGDWYEPEVIEATRKALVGLGIFSSVNIVPTDSNALSQDSGFIDYKIIVREGRPGSVSFGPGWSRSDGGRYEIDSSYFNLGGMGRQIFGSASLVEERDQQDIEGQTLLGRTFTISYLEPYLFTWPINGTVTLGHKATAEKERWDLSRSILFSFGHQLRNFFDDSFVRFFYGQKITDEKSAVAFENSLVATGNVRSGRLGLEFHRENRNDLTWPTDGSFFKISATWARYFLGGDLRYFKWDINNNYYFQIHDKVVFATGYNISAYEGVERKGDIPNILPASERFTAGGPEDNRGFEKRTLGPTTPIRVSEDLRDPTTKLVNIDGTHRTSFKAELRYHFAESYGLTLFTDSSTVFFTYSEIEEMRNSLNPVPDVIDNYPYQYIDLLTDPRRIWDSHYVSYGLALNYLSPLGSFNFSFGFPLKRCPNAINACEFNAGKTDKNFLKTFVFHINISANF